MSTPETSTTSGTRVGGRYTLVRPLGKGGMGAVWEAVRDGGARVAIKLLLDELGNDAAALSRFQREASHAAALNHPHIVEVLDFFHEPGAPPGLVMECLDGVSLAYLLNVERQLPPARASRIAVQVLSALESAHAAGIVHRDVKPANVFLASIPGMPEMVKVLDFGIAKLLESEAAARLTRTGTVLGTPGFMAPEQMRAEKVDARSDLYAVGVLLYAMLAGDIPFRGRNVAETLMAMLHGTIRPLEQARPDVPPGLAAVTRRALAMDPAHRYQSAGEMIAALAPYREDRPGATGAVAAPVPTPAPAPAAPAPNAVSMPTTRETRPGRAFPWLIAAAVGAVLLGVMVASVGLLWRFAAGSEPPPAPVQGAPAMPLPQMPMQQMPVPQPGMAMPPMMPTATPVVPQQVLPGSLGVPELSPIPPQATDPNSTPTPTPRPIKRRGGGPTGDDPRGPNVMPGPTQGGRGANTGSTEGSSTFSLERRADGTWGPGGD